MKSTFDFPNGTFIERVIGLANQLDIATISDTKLVQIDSLSTIRYLTNFSGSNATLLIETRHDLPLHVWFITDSRYIDQANLELSDLLSATQFCVEIVNQHKMPAKTLIKSAFASSAPANLFVEPNHFSLSSYLAIAEVISDAATISDISESIASLRATKDPTEIARGIRAADIASHAFTQMTNSLSLRATELDLARELNYEMMKFGADGIAFDTIVASGPNSSFPHAKPTSRQLRNGDVVVIDFGAQFLGYRSDCTRTIAVGGEFSNSQITEAYKRVKVAQQAGIASSKVGARFSEVDAACRQGLPESDRKYFTHGTGHGVGLDIHEAPWVSSSYKSLIKKDMLFTIEPGIYFPGDFGIRIEDTVLSATTGPRQITKLPK